MSWAARRRFTILSIIGAVVVVALVIIFSSVFYKAPSCTDGIQNQGEEGVDCGGPCPYLCTALEQAPTVLFTKVLTNAAGRTDIIASVENKNITVAAENVSYHVALYSADHTPLQEISGTLDLPPGATVPVFLPGVVSGNQAVATAFLTIDSSSLRWFTMTKDTRVIPGVSSVTQGGSPDMPRIAAVLANGDIKPLTNVQAIVVVRDANNDVIAASQTVLPLIPPQGTATAIFTWNNAFSGVPTTIQVTPLIPLPRN